MKALGFSAKGAKCKSLGQRPRGYVQLLEALKARNQNVRRTISLTWLAIIPRFQRLDPLTGITWAVGPGYYISRLWRWEECGFHPLSASSETQPMVHVKICGITNLDDALASVEAGAHALGFNFYERSPRYIEPLAARDIIQQVPASIMCVGVFVNVPDTEQVRRMAGEAGVRAVQLHGDESPAYCQELKGLFVIKALRVNHNFDPEQAARYETEAVLLDGFSPVVFGGTGHAFDWSIAVRTRPLVDQLFLAGGLSESNVATAIESVQPYAVDACSALESAPGRKDVAKVLAFIEATRGLGFQEQ